MSENNNLQERIADALERIADCLDELLGMIQGVQPKELAKRAQEHKKAQANLKKQKKGDKKNE